MTSDLFRKIEQCRVCKNDSLIAVFDLGDQCLSGLFPKTIDHNMHRGPLKLVKCDEATGGCGHIQLEHTFDLSLMYGDNYGYRSGLNQSMVKHLQLKNQKISEFISLEEGDLVVDIAGNDGTFLGFFPVGLRLVSIDPTSKKFSKHYKPHVSHIADFFSEAVFRQNFQDQKARLITSFSMFYDLEDPCGFARDINSVLDPTEGIWVLEQSYMPEMLKMNSFDTVCHEHLSYYGMRQIKYIMDQSGFKIVDFDFNDVNGGSVSVTVANKDSIYNECSEKLFLLIQEEIDLGLSTAAPWVAFQNRIDACENELLDILKKLRSEGLRIAALGASTKGNVILQTWNISDYIEAVGDVNPDKDGSFTPGTWIPIKDEDSVLAEYDAFIILPWHFKEFFMNNPKFKGKKLLFPLPTPQLFQL